MNNSFEPLQDIKLSSEERASLWLQINTSIANQEINGAAVITEQNNFNNWMTKLTGIVGVPAFAAILIFFGAQNSLPGDMLYTFKVGVNEPLQRLAVTGSVEKLELERDLLFERVEEAKRLRAMGLLDLEKAAEIEVTIANQAAKVIETKEKEEQKTVENNVTKDESEIVSDKLDSDIALAEFKGSASGSINAVRALAGKETEEPVATKKSSQSDLEISADSTQEINVQNVESSSNTTKSDKVTKSVSETAETDPEVTKVKLQAQAKITTKKAEVAQVITAETKDDALNDEVNKLVDDKVLQEVKKFADKNIQAAKQVVDNNDPAVAEDQLLEAVEKASAAIAITEALTETKNQ